MAGPTYAAFNTSTYTSAGSAAHNITINKPSGLSDGDVLVVYIATRQDDGVSRSFSTDLVFDAAYPWTKVRESRVWSSTATSRLYVFSRLVVSAASEPASYTVTINFAASQSLISCTICVRVSSAGPLRYYNTDADMLDQGSANITFNTVTTTLPNTLLLFGVDARTTQTSITFTTATSITLVTVTLTASCSVAVGYLAQSAIGGSITETATWGSNTTIANNHIMALASDLVAPILWVKS